MGESINWFIPSTIWGELRISMTFMISKKKKNEIVNQYGWQEVLDVNKDEWQEVPYPEIQDGWTSYDLFKNKLSE